MSIIRKLLIVILPAAITGCGTVPLPQHVTGFDTYQIVQRARCEVRDAIRDHAAKYVKYAAERPDLYDHILNGTINLEELRQALVHPDAVAVIDRYSHAAVAYDFEFDMTVFDKLEGTVGFMKAISAGPLSFGLKAGRDKTRQNVRVLKISDTFSKLSFSLKNSICKSVAGRGNGSYPITGKLGLKNIVQMFLDLNQSGNLVGDSSTPTIADTITFTTVLTGGIEPALKLVPSSSITGVTFAASQKRTDVHKLTITLALPPTKPGSGNPATIAENRAFQELEIQRQRQLDKNSVILRASILSAPL